ELDHDLARLRPPAPELEAQSWRMTENEPQLGLGDRQVLTRANEKRDTRPAPVVDFEPHGRVCLGFRVLCNPLYRTVAVVLPAHVVSRVGVGHRAEDGEHRVL